MDIATYLDLGHVDRATIARCDAASCPPWMALCRHELAAKRRVNLDLAQKIASVKLAGVETGIDPRPTMVRVAWLAERALRPDTAPAESRPRDLAEDLLLQALHDDKPEPLAWAGLPNVTLPVLLVGKAWDATWARYVDFGVVARLKLRRVPVGDWPGQARRFVPAPASFLLQHFDRRLVNGEWRKGHFEQALEHAAAVLQRHLDPGRPKPAEALVWDLQPPLGQSLLAIGGKGPFKKAVAKNTEDWRASAKIRRLWHKDKSVWTDDDEHKWLGWLTSAAAADVADYEDFARRVKGQNFSDAVVLGMGGSSLGPEVLAETFSKKSGFPKLHVLDSTDPAQVRAMEASVNIAKTLFIVSSKSGGTTEPNAMKDYFFDRVSRAVGTDKAGHRFIAVTDPGSSLEKVATKQGFARIFHGDPTIGGRYSVLSPFGLVPAAAAGIDIRSLITHALAMVRSCGADVPPHENPGVQLGLAMGLAGLEGRDKVTITSSKKIADFGAWAEQLIAESTGKDGKGLIPIDSEPLGDPSIYGHDRFFIDIRTEGEDDAAHDAKLAALEAAGHPVVRIAMKSIDHIGQEFFRFEMATAVAGAVLGINPFNQPDVEAAKIKTRELTGAFEKTGSLPAEKPVMATAEADIYTDEANAAALRQAGANGTLGSWIRAHLSRSGSGDYVALLAYIARDGGSIGALQKMRLAVRDKRHVATCAEFGPRFLHSTGQAYKGGPDSGVFLQITADDARDLPVPGQKASFGVIKAAQARGDFDVLTERGRRALRVHLKGSLGPALAALDAAISEALN